MCAPVHPVEGSRTPCGSLVVASAHHGASNVRRGETKTSVQKTAVGFLFRIVLPCDLSAVRQAAISARETLAAHRMPEQHLAACELALVEACNNAVLYADEHGRQAPVEIQLLAEGTNLELQ